MGGNVGFQSGKQLLKIGNEMQFGGPMHKQTLGRRGLEGCCFSASSGKNYDIMPIPRAKPPLMKRNESKYDA